MRQDLGQPAPVHVPATSQGTEPGHAPPRTLALTLNSDGERHALLNAGTYFTLVAGILAFALGLVVRAHLEATIVGAIAFGTGMYVQLVSTTREQRILIVTGMVGAFVGLGLGLAHGGF